MTITTDEAWATVADLAAEYSVTEETVRNRVRSGAWPAARDGRMIRFSPEHQQAIREQWHTDRRRTYRPDLIREAMRARRAA